MADLTPQDVLNQVTALETRVKVLEADVAAIKEDDKKLHGVLDWMKEKLSNPVVSAFVTALITAATIALTGYIAARNNVVPGVSADKPALVEPADDGKIDALKERLKGGGK